MSITIIEDSKESEPEKQETQPIDVENIIEATAAAVVDAVEATKETETADVEAVITDQAYYFSELKTLVESINNKIDMLIDMENDEAAAEIVEELDGKQEPQEPQEPEIVDGVANAIDNPAETIVGLTSKPENTGVKTWI